MAETSAPETKQITKRVLTSRPFPGGLVTKAAEAPATPLSEAEAALDQAQAAIKQAQSSAEGSTSNG